MTVKWGPMAYAARLLCLAILVLLPILMAGAIKVWPELDQSLAYKCGIWPLILLDIYGVMLVVGHGIIGQFFGFLIDERNRMSNSRFQITIWTLVAIPGLLVFIYFNIAHGAPNPTNIAIPPQLWVLLGISGGAAIGAPIVNDATNRSKGELDVNTTVEDASFADIFEGDEKGNCDYLDISKCKCS